jgi:transcriptional regulator with XRE-family HTH domain
MTQADLAKAIGITRGHLTKLEAGNQQAKGSVIIAIRAIGLLGHPDTWPESITMTKGA